MTLVRFLYFSVACLAGDVTAQVAELAEQSAAANAKLGIKGALLFDGRRFAQLIEGPEAEITALALRIAADTRHTGMVILQQEPVRELLFERFSLVYSGSSLFVARSIPPSVPELPDDRRLAVRSLTQVMLEFAR